MSKFKFLMFAKNKLWCYSDNLKNDIADCEVSTNRQTDETTVSDIEKIG